MSIPIPISSAPCVCQVYTIGIWRDSITGGEVVVRPALARLPVGLPPLRVMGTIKAGEHDLSGLFFGHRGGVVSLATVPLPPRSRVLTEHQFSLKVL